MKLVESGTIVELAELIGSAIGTLVFTIGGLLTEQAALQNVVSGNMALGTWEAVMGGTAILVGIYLLGYREFLPRFKIFFQT